MSPNSASSAHDIAIVGMSGRFPGARDIDEFWRNVRDGVESRTEFTDQDLAAEGLSSKVRHPRHVRAGFLMDDVDMFDSGFFGINPKEADTLDPQHRVFLECAWHALENAGYDAERFPGTIGLFAGSTWCNYLINNVFRCMKLLKTMGHRQLIFGSVPDYMVTRAAYRLNLTGPAYFVQTACSTSLSAVHLGAQSLVGRESDMVLAGGVSVKVPQRVGYVYEEGGMESPDGRVRTFDANAKGTVFSSGVAVVVLRRLEDARRDGDHIYAVIKGTAINNDGAVKVGFTAPSVTGQAAVIAQAIANARVSPEEIDYVETHGTGTELGDPIELAALTRAFSAHTERRNFCAVGSVKPNVGHLDAAAGVSSLIKAVLAMQHGQLPPTINFETLNPKIEIEDSPFYINTTLRDWPRNGHPRRAGVSSFGFGGTNAHVIIEEPPAPQPSGPSRSHQLLLVSARTRGALDEATLRLANYLSHDARVDLADVAYSLHSGRRQFAHRRAVVCQTRDEAIEALHSGTARWAVSGQADANDRRIVFLFPGQGAQYVQMGRGLYDSEPTFRSAVDRCASVLQQHLGFDLRAVLYPADDAVDEASERLMRTVVTQAAVFTIEYALATLWMKWGIVPAAMVGHSIGEFVAACLSGVLTLEDALRLVAVRGTLMEGMPAGAMLAVPLPETQVADLLDDGLWLAAANGPSFCVASGRPDAIERLELTLRDRGVEGRRLRTSHAFHSGLMDGAVDAFVEAVRGVPRGAPTIPYLSNVTGDWMTPELAQDPSYWGRHIRETVRFADNVAALLQTDKSVFLEVGPGNTLSTFVRQQMQPAAHHIVVASLRHPQEDSADAAFLLHALGKMWVAGVAADATAFFGEQQRRRVPLPGYPFERTRHWVEPDKPKSGAARRANMIAQQEDVADWFYVPSWKRSALLHGDTPAAGHERSTWLIFADEGGVGESVGRELAARGHHGVLVRAGDAYAHDASGFVVNPSSADDFDQLVRALRRDGPLPAAVVHLWCLGDDERVGDDWHERGFYTLLHFAQALGEAGCSSKLRLNVVTSGVHDVTGDEPLVPRKATVLGPARVIPFEFPNISTREIDVESRAAADRESLANRLADELLAPVDDPTIAFRRGHRWVQTYEPARLETKSSAQPRLRDGGTYLITGGFGGIGLVLANHLAAAGRCNLVLVGRRGVPPRETWDGHLAAHGADDAVSRRILAVRQLETAGARVFVGDADVADAARMQAVVDAARAEFGRIDGVIHSAGVAGGGMIQLKKRDVAEAVIRPKRDGTEVIGEVFRHDRLDFFLLCSSLTSVLGAVGQVDYCAANAYLDAFARWYTVQTGTFTVAVNWSAWQEVGMAVETDMPDALKSTMRERMLAAGLTNREGIDAFGRILQSVTEPQVVVSPLDVQLLLEHLRERSADEELAADRDAAVESHARPDLPSAYLEPRTDTERQICRIWAEMLGIAGIGVTDNFFELGGHSLLAVRVMARVNDTFHSDVPVAKLYEGLTVAYLAHLIEGNKTSDSAHTDDDARELRREKARRQKQHQQRRLAAVRR